MTAEEFKAFKMCVSAHCEFTEANKQITDASSYHLACPSFARKKQAARRW